MRLGGAGLVALGALAGCEAAPGEPPAEIAAVATVVPPDATSPSSIAPVSSVPLQKMSREEFLEAVIAKRVPALRDAGGLYPDDLVNRRFSSVRTVGHDEFWELSRFLEEELQPGDVAGAPDCVLPSREKDRGARCCVEGPVPIVNRAMALVEVGPRKVLVPVYLVGPDPAVLRGDRRRFCGVVARFANTATPAARVPALLGYFQTTR